MGTMCDGAEQNRGVSRRDRERFPTGCGRSGGQLLAGGRRVVHPHSRASVVSGEQQEDRPPQRPRGSRHGVKANVVLRNHLRLSPQKAIKAFLSSIILQLALPNRTRRTQ